MIVGAKLCTTTGTHCRSQVGEVSQIRKPNKDKTIVMV